MAKPDSKYRVALNQTENLRDLVVAGAVFRRELDRARCTVSTSSQVARNMLWCLIDAGFPIADSVMAERLLQIVVWP